MVKKVDDKFSRFDTIPACDRRTVGQTDRQTAYHGIVCAMHTRRLVKIRESSGESTQSCKTPTMVLNQSEVSPLTLSALNASLYIFSNVLIIVSG